MKTHNELINEVLLFLGSRPDCIVWRNETGKARAMHQPERIISYGLVGSSDVIGTINPGLSLYIECKAGCDTQRIEQKRFQKAIQGVGALYVIYRGDKKDLLRRVESHKHAKL